MALTETGFVFAPRIPRGLAPAVEGLAREILRRQPRDVYAFAAQHFDKLIELREKQHDDGDIVVSTRTAHGREFIRDGRKSCVFDRDPERNECDDYGDCDEERSAVPRIIDFANEAAKDQPVETQLPKKRRKEATPNRSGWSVNRTVEAYKKRSGSRVAERKNAARPKKAYNAYNEKQGFHDPSRRRSPRSSSTREVARCRFARSSSAGDVLARTVEHRRLSSENSEKYYGSGASTTCCAANREPERHGGTIKRQRSADHIERRSCERGQSASEARCDLDRRRSPFVAIHDPSERNDCVAKRGFAVSRNRRDRREASARDEQTETFRHAIETVSKSLRRDPRSDRLDGVDAIADDRTIPEQSASIDRRDCSNDLVVLPSVAVRLSSNNGCTINDTRNDVQARCVERIARNDGDGGDDGDDDDDDGDGDELILPPISADALRPIDREGNATAAALPLLSGITEISRERRRTSIRSKTAIVDEDDDDGLSTDEKRMLEALGTTRPSNLSETEIDEIFKDSLNVTPDSVERSQRSSDSLERPSEEERKKEEESRRKGSSELKNKLIEIETVEKIIESTLASSGTIVRQNNDQIVRRSDFDIANENSKLSLNENAIDVNRTNVTTTKNDCWDRNDLSCYVLDEDFRCEIPESVTTVIIPDKTQRSDDDDDDDDDDFASNHKVESRRDRHGDDSFGEYVSPRASIEYSTNIDAHFLNGIKSAADRTTVRQDLKDIREEEEELEGKKVDAADPVDSRFAETALETAKTVNYWSNLDRKYVEDRRPTSSPLVRDEPLESASGRRTRRRSMDAKVRVNSVRSNERRIEFISLQEPSSPSSRHSLTASEPFVPELNLDSLRDATISSSTFERNDSRSSCASRSEKENDGDDDDNDVTLREGGEVFPSIDALPLSTKMTVDENLSSESETGREERVFTDCENRSARIENDVIDAMIPSVKDSDSDNVEDEIARELIGNLTLETSSLLDANPAIDSCAAAATVHCSTDDQREGEKEDGEKIGNVDLEDSSLSRFLLPETACETTTDFQDIAETLPDARDECFTDGSVSVENTRSCTPEFANRNCRLRKTEQEYGNRGVYPTETASIASTSASESCEECAEDERQESELEGCEKAKETMDGIRNGAWSISPITSTARVERPQLLHELFDVWRNEATTEHDSTAKSNRQIPILRFNFKPDVPTFNFDSPRFFSSVLCTFDLSPSVQPIGNEYAHWLERCSRNVPPFCVVGVERVLNKTDATPSPSTEPISSSDADDVREPLALIDETPRSVLIEEIFNDDDDDGENKAQRVSSDLRPENSSLSLGMSADSENTGNRRRMSRNASLTRVTVDASDDDSGTDRLLDSSELQSDENHDVASTMTDGEREQSTTTESKV